MIMFVVCQAIVMYDSLLSFVIYKLIIYKTAHLQSTVKLPLLLPYLQNLNTHFNHTTVL